MNKLKIMLLIVCAVVGFILIFFLVKNFVQSDRSNNSDDKTLSEIKYMEDKLSNLFNGVGNINLDTNKILATKVSTSTNTNSNSNSSESGQESDSKQNTSENKSSSSSDSQQIALKKEGILINQKNIDWEEIKNQVEDIYSLVPTITLDLYNLNIKQSEILNFNKKLDELTIVAKEENEDETLKKIVELYQYLPYYAKSFSKDSEYISLLETKSNLFSCYMLARANDWEGASSYIKKAIESYTSILNNIDTQNNNYDTNKNYIVLNELQNAIEIKDIDVFLIKYKVFLEESEKLRN